MGVRGATEHWLRGVGPRTGLRALVQHDTRRAEALEQFIAPRCSSRLGNPGGRAGSDRPGLAQALSVGSPSALRAGATHGDAGSVAEHVCPSRGRSRVRRPPDLLTACFSSSATRPRLFVAHTKTAPLSSLPCFSPGGDRAPVERGTARSESARTDSTPRNATLRRKRTWRRAKRHWSPPAPCAPGQRARGADERGGAPTVLLGDRLARAEFARA